MATVSVTRGNTLPNSSQKADFHNLIDLATGSVSNIVNADIDSAAAIADTKLATISTANKVSVSALGTISGLTEKVSLTGDDLFLINDSAASNATKKVKSSTLASAYTFTPSAANALAGSVVQIVNVTTGAVGTGSTTTPNDDTIPAITEGNEILTTSYTPLSATNKLIFIASITVNESTNTGVAVAVALHRATVTDALCVATADASSYAGSSAPEPTVLVHYMTAPGTSTYTFSIRAGCDTGPVTWNGVNGGRKYGGVLISSLTIIEVKAS